MTRRARLGTVLGVLLGLAVAAAVAPSLPFNPLAASVQTPGPHPRAAEALSPTRYTVAIGGDVDRVDVSWSDGSGRVVTERGVALPWSRSVTTDAGRRGPLVVVSAVAVTDAPGTVTCRIERPTRVVDLGTGRGPRPFANCHGT